MTKKWVLALCLLFCGLTLAAPGLAQLEFPADGVTTSPEETPRTAAWGIEVSSGRIAIDPTLIYFIDPSQGTLVINPAYADEALADLSAQDNLDGTWGLPQGKFKPIFGQVAMVDADTPPEALATARMEGIDASTVQRVEQVGANAKQSRRFRRCNGCTGCNNGCQGNLLVAGPSEWRYCRGSIWPWHKCTEELVPTCKVQIFQCLNCTGSVLTTTQLNDWVCANSCS